MNFGGELFSRGRLQHYLADFYRFLSEFLSVPDIDDTKKEILAQWAPRHRWGEELEIEARHPQILASTSTRPDNRWILLSTAKGMHKYVNDMATTNIRLLFVSGFAGRP